MTFLLILAAALAACGPAAAGPGSAPAGWTIYLEADHGFSLAYPPDGRLTDQQAGYTRIDLPIEAGTTLVEKYVEVTISQDAYPCPTTTLNTETASPPQETTVNGLTFLEQSGGGVATGNIYEWVGYSTRQGNVCAGLTFVLHYTDPANYMDPPPVFDRAAEEQVFTVILGTFQWAGP
jgi:hypothetical protein